MRLAIKEASRALGCTAPNPAVGAVIVKNGRIVAKGYHQAAGLPHAEIEALAKAGFIPHYPSPILHHLKGATLYVTLEPCSSHGRTPPAPRRSSQQGSPGSFTERLILTSATVDALQGFSRKQVSQ